MRLSDCILCGFIYCFYDTAVRIIGLINIRLCDIAMESKYPSIFIIDKGNKERTIQFDLALVSDLPLVRFLFYMVVAL